MGKLLLETIRKGAEAVRASTLVSAIVPEWIEERVRRRLFTTEYIVHLAALEISAKNIPSESDYPSDYPWKIGIVKDKLFKHASYAAACRELKVAYSLVDIFATDWVDQFRRSGCDTFAVWPSEVLVEWKNLYDSRLRFLTNHMQKPIYPSSDALWLYGSKERMRDWLDINGFPHPATWVFYEIEEALAFLATAACPLVVKLDIGAAANGVWLVKTRGEAVKLVRQAFGAGLSSRRSDLRARQWRHILFQEFVPNLREWRMIRIGDSYFGHEKGKSGEFHSGSGVVGWFAPPRRALDLLHEVTERGGFRSMDMDVFELPDGRLLINELQSVFGSYDTAQMYIDGVPGRYQRIKGEFVFEEGRYCGNSCCTLRIQDLIQYLARHHGEGGKQA
jgi:hypothetical protein